MSNMEHYNDEKNKAGAKVIFLFAQLIVLGIVYIFVYTSFLAVGYAIEKYDASVVMYFPVLVATLVFPILMYKYRQMFHQGKMLVATIWMMATASLTIVLLYVYIAQITG